MARERGACATGDGASTVIASDSEATQTEPQLETLVWVASLCSR